MTYKYKTVPFIGKLQEGENPAKVSAQIDAVIAKECADGWEFYQLAATNIEVAPGCMAAFLGGKAAYVHFDQLIFRKSA